MAAPLQGEHVRATQKKISYPQLIQEEIKDLDNERVNILLVDDLPEKIMVYEVILEDLGQNLVVAKSGEEALKLVLEQEFAVILLDVNMPGIDGFETASLIRSRKKSAHTPIIFLTAFPDEMRMAQGYASGAVDYIPTPVVPEILQAKIKVFIELSQMRRQAASQAEEKAMRAAAEESARRFAYLGKASEILARSQNHSELLQVIATLSIPYLADASMIWLAGAKPDSSQIKWARNNANGTISDKPLANSLEDLPWLDKAVSQAITTGQHKIIDNIPEIEMIGTPLAGSALIIPLNIRGHTSGVITLLRTTSGFQPNDISLASDFVARAGVALENSLLLEKIREGDHRKDEFLAMLAHELRNPLAPIRNAIQVMKLSRDHGLREQAQDTIERQLKHMVHLVDDLMDISRITQGKIELRKELIALNDVLNHAVETAEPLIKQRNHNLKIQLPDNPIWLKADFARISQIFSNLLNNAAKYTNNGGQIELAAEQEGKSIVISVTDNGIGIPSEMLSLIFDMFSQVDSSLERAQGGLGIGLTLVKSLVEMHGGSIEASSDGAQKGSKFIVRLPVANEKLVETSVKEQKPNEATKVSLKVLVVDDNEASAKTMSWMIQLTGHEVKLAFDGQSAIEIAKSYQPEIIMLDIGLPGMNGYEVCKIMHTDLGLKNTIFIAQTGWGQEEHRQRSKDAGFHHHFVKPVDMQKLQQLLGECAAA